MSTSFHFFLLWLSLLFCPLAFAAPYPLITDSLNHQDRVRTFHLYQPITSAQAKKPIPTIIALHGGGKRGGKAMGRHLGLNKIAKQQHLMIVYPEGIRSQWNDGRETSYRGKQGIEQVDDVGFLSKLTQKLISHYGADAKRIYLLGVSNGGMMSQRLACEASEQFAAIATVIASMPQKIYPHCNPKYAPPMLLMNGTADPFIPYWGGDVVILGKRAGKVLSTPATLAFWLKQHRINSRPTVRVLADINKKDHSTVVKKTWFDQQHKERVVLYRINKGGHQWPSSTHRLTLKKLLGAKNQDIKGAEVIWDFFKQHVR
jgi:polyhydroxybutyrate depolymerase